MDVNPFNQPGVEKYKRNMFKLLKKPGYWFQIYRYILIFERGKKLWDLEIRKMQKEKKMV